MTKFSRMFLRMERFAKRFPCLFASLWFAVAGLIVPTLWFLLATLKRGDIVSAVLYGVLPVVAAAIAGALLGTPIVCSAQAMSARRAIERGVGVGLLAVAIFVPLFAMCYAGTARQGIVYVPALMGVVAVMCVFVAGIPIALIAGTAGWLLYRLALHIDRTIQT